MTYYILFMQNLVRMNISSARKVSILAILLVSMVLLLPAEIPPATVRAQSNGYTYITFVSATSQVVMNNVWSEVYWNTPPNPTTGYSVQFNIQGDYWLQVILEVFGSNDLECWIYMFQNQVTYLGSGKYLVTVTNNVVFDASKVLPITTAQFDSDAVQVILSNTNNIAGCTVQGAVNYYVSWTLPYKENAVGYNTMIVGEGNHEGVTFKAASATTLETDAVNNNTNPVYSSGFTVVRSGSYYYYADGTGESSNLVQNTVSQPSYQHQVTYVIGSG
jgi:hypothetical protein